jgi:hypothetical protein
LVSSIDVVELSVLGGLWSTSACSGDDPGHPTPRSGNQGHRRRTGAIGVGAGLPASGRRLPGVRAVADSCRRQFGAVREQAVDYSALP